MHRHDDYHDFSDPVEFEREMRRRTDAPNRPDLSHTMILFVIVVAFWVGVTIGLLVWR